MSDDRKLPPISDEEEARIQAGIAEDDDNPEWTEEDFRNARPFAEVFPEMAATIREKAARQDTISLSLDRDLIEKIHNSGPGWQDRVNDALRAWLERAS